MPERSGVDVLCFTEESEQFVTLTHSYCAEIDLLLPSPQQVSRPKLFAGSGGESRPLQLQTQAFTLSLPPTQQSQITVISPPTSTKSNVSRANGTGPGTGNTSSVSATPFVASGSGFVSAGTGTSPGTSPGTATSKATANKKISYAAVVAAAHIINHYR